MLGRGVSQCVCSSGVDVPWCGCPPNVDVCPPIVWVPPRFWCPAYSGCPPSLLRMYGSPLYVCVIIRLEFLSKGIFIPRYWCITALWSENISQCGWWTSDECILGLVYWYRGFCCWGSNLCVQFIRWLVDAWKHVPDCITHFFWHVIIL